MIGIASNGKRRIAVAEPVKPTFERFADEIMAEIRETYTGRGQEYGDTFDLDNLCTAFTAQALRDLFGVEGSTEHLRALITAGRIDDKLSRLRGKWKRDTVLDLAAYVAFYTKLRDELDSHVHIKEKPP